LVRSTVHISSASSLGLLGVRSLVGIGLLSLGGISGVLFGIGLLLATRLLAAAAAAASGGAATVAGTLEREEAKGCCDWTSASANSKNAQGMSTWWRISGVIESRGPLSEE
jgi:hypothetical protein